MEDRKIQIVQSNGPAHNRRYNKEPDVWSKLRGDEDFKNLNSAKAWTLVSAAVAEVLGTATFVGLGCSSIIGDITGATDHASHLNVALTFACAIALVVTVFGHISGCHVNPAVSLSAVIFGHLSIPKFLIYVVCQCIGSCLGIAAVKVISPYHCTANSFCVTQPNPEVGAGAAMLSEALLTGILVWVVNAAWDRRCQDKHDSLPVKFGLVIVALVIPGAKYSGASLNPARSFGPALLAGNWEGHYVYWIGPLCGSIVASYIYKTLLSEVNPPKNIEHLNVNTEEAEEEHPL